MGLDQVMGMYNDFPSVDELMEGIDS